MPDRFGSTAGGPGCRPQRIIGSKVELRRLAQHQLRQEMPGERADGQTRRTQAVANDQPVQPRDPPQHRLEVWAHGAEADTRFQQGGRAEPGRNGQGLVQDLSLTRCRDAIVEATADLARGPDHHPGAAEGHQVVATPGQHDWPGIGIDALEAQMGDLPAPRRDREGDAHGLQHLRRPGPGRNDHGVRRDLLGVDPDPGHPRVAGQQPGCAGVESRAAALCRLTQRGGKQTSIDAGTAADMHRSEVRA